MSNQGARRGAGGGGKGPRPPKSPPAKATPAPSGKAAAPAATARPGEDAAKPAEKKKRVGPALFIKQVRQEVAKVTWPTRNETTVTTIMVFIFVTIAAIFFLIVDLILSRLVEFVLGLGA